MAKGKKAKKEKKAFKAGSGKAGALKALAQSPMVAEVVAAALVATAAALKDPKRARALASDGAGELTKLSKTGAKAGDVLWDMALQIGHRSLKAFTGEGSPEKPESKSKPNSISKAPAAATVSK
jgi:hypothetical protein